MGNNPIDEELASFAEQVGQELETVRSRFRESGQLPGLRSTLQKNKALEWLLDQIEVVDETGAAVDRSALADEPAEANDSETDAGDPDDAS